MDDGDTRALFKGEKVEEFNYAVVCGKPSSGLVVIDFDDRPKGIQHPVDTLTVETGKGIHYYVRIRDGRQGNRSFPGAHLDIRAQGGIAIGPPSQHPSGAVYKVVRDRPIVETTDAWLNDYLSRVLAGTNATVTRKSNPQGWFAETFAETCEEGGRDNTLTKLAGYLLNKVPADDAMVILDLWASINCVPALTPYDVRKTIDSLLRREVLNEVRNTPSDVAVAARPVYAEDALFEHL